MADDDPEVAALKAKLATALDTAPKRRGYPVKFLVIAVAVALGAIFVLRYLISRVLDGIFIGSQ